MQIVILFLGLCVAMVMGEHCDSTADCNLEHCTPSDWVIGCHAHTCTCDDPSGGGSCQHSSDCNRCQNGHRGFCLLGACRCGFNNNGK